MGDFFHRLERERREEERGRERESERRAECSLGYALGRRITGVQLRQRLGRLCEHEIEREREESKRMGNTKSSPDKNGLGDTPGKKERERDSHASRPVNHINECQFLRGEYYHVCLSPSLSLSLSVCLSVLHPAVVMYITTRTERERESIRALSIDFTS